MTDHTTLPLPLKRCPHCKEYKSLDRFNRNKTAKDGFDWRCKDCRRTPSSLLAEEDKLSIPEGQKRCTKCREIKSLEAFSRCKRNKDGVYSHCKACHRAYATADADKTLQYMRDYHRANSERLGKYNRLRYIQNIEWHRQHDRLYYQANAEQAKSRASNWYYANQELGKERRRRHYAANRESLIQKTYQWTVANPERVSETQRRYRHRRRALIAQIGGYFTAQDVAHMRAIQQGHCCYCGRIGQLLTLEHIIPVTREGSSNNPWNLAFACRSCNSSKGDKLLSEWTDRWYLR
jgi:5-methylcytosine-specific restriction endonuclease McrA